MDHTTLHRRSLPGQGNAGKFRTCDICYGQKFKKTDAGQIRCVKCGQIYYV